MPLIPESLTDLNRLRDLLEISTSYTDADAVLTQLVNGVTRSILTQGHIGSLKYHSVTEIKDGGNHPLLVMNYYPIVSITSIHQDNLRVFGANTLVPAACYEIRQDFYSEEIPNSGIIRNLEGNWYNGKSNIQVIYTSGFSSFLIQEGVNDQLIVDEGSTDITISLTEGKYNAVTLATEIQTQLDAGITATATVTYSTISHRYKITASSGTFSLNWESAGTRHKELGKLLGFDVSEDDTGSLTYISDYPVLGIPEDLIDGVNSIIRWRFAEIHEKYVGKSSSTGRDESFSFNFNEIPSYMVAQIEPYFNIRM